MVNSERGTSWWKSKHFISTFEQTMLNKCPSRSSKPALGKYRKMQLFPCEIWEGINPASRSVMVFNSSPQSNTILVDYTCRLQKTFPWPFQTNCAFKEACKPASTAVWSWSDPSSAKRKLFDCGAGSIHSHPDHRHAGYSVPVCLISWCTGSASDPRLRPGPCSR